MRAWSVSVAVSASQHRCPCLGPAQVDLPGDGGYVDRLSQHPVAGAAHEPAAGVPAGEALVGVVDRPGTTALDGPTREVTGLESGVREPLRDKPGEVGRLIGGRVDVARAGQAAYHADHGIAEQDLQVVLLAVLGQRHLARAVDQLTTDPGAALPGQRDVRAPAPGRLELRRGVRLEVVARERQLRGARVPELTAATDRAVMKRVPQTVEAQGPPGHTITVQQDEQVAHGVAPVNTSVPRRPRRSVVSV